MMKVIKKYSPLWLGLIVLIVVNSYPIFREAPSIGMSIMYVVGYFQLTKLD